MSALDHWHPVMLSRELGKAPFATKVHGRDLVVFRTSAGVAAQLDRCPHRGARLSRGHVENDCVVCPYHLWSYDADGRGTSPVNPRMKPRNTAFDAREFEGAVWVRARGSELSLPEFAHDGMHFIGHEHGWIDANYRFVCDNFSEIEHSPTNHFVFAFDREGITEVEPKVDLEQDCIHINYTGPQRKTPWWSGANFIGIDSSLNCRIDFYIYFSPIHWRYDITWTDPDTGELVPNMIREYAFITPETDGRTNVMLWFYTTNPLFAPGTLRRLIVRPFFLALAKNEFNLDKKICENVASIDNPTDLTDCQLGKFDRVLRDLRVRLDTVYEQRDSSAPALAVVADGP